MQILNRVYKKVSVQFTHKTQYYVPNSGILVSRKTIEGKTSQSKTNNSPKKSEAQEFYLMEKLYEAMRNDKARGKKPSAAREFYLMERLYEAMRNDKSRNQKLKDN